MQAKLYIACPNIVSSMYAQQQLKEKLDFEILGNYGKPHFSDRFLVITPPEGCSRLMFEIERYIAQNKSYFYIGTEKERHKNCPACKKVQNDRPLILFQKTTMDHDGHETYDKTKDWIPMFDALRLIGLCENIAPLSAI